MAISDTLLAYYKLDESSGDVIDVHNANDHTTVTGVTRGNAGLIGNMYDFDGNDVTEGPSFDMGGTGTILLWIKTTFTGPMILVSVGDASTNNDMFSIGARLRNTKDVVEWNIWSTSGGQFQIMYDNTAEDLDVFDGNWHQIGMSFDGTTTILYADGEVLTHLHFQSGSGEEWYDDMVNVDVITLGVASRLSKFYWYEGQLDEVGIWSTKLSDSQVSELYNGGSGLAYKFGESGGINSIEMGFNF